MLGEALREPSLEAGGPHSIALCLGLGVGDTGVAFQLLPSELLSSPDLGGRWSWEASFPELACP